METQDSKKLAVLEERTMNIKESVDSLREESKTVNQDVKKMNQNLERILGAINRIEDVESTAERNADMLARHDQTGKIILFLITISGGLVGWSWHELQGLKDKDAEIKQRVEYLEYLQNVPRKNTND